MTHWHCSRFSLFLVSAIVGFVLSNCHHRTGTYDPTKYQQVNGDGYAARKINDGEYVVAAIDNQALERAKARIGCTKEYVCLVEKDGEWFSVQVRKRQ